MLCSSAFVQGLNVIAYAMHCQTDQYGRPIAGSINICPQLLNDPDYIEEKVSKVAMKLCLSNSSSTFWCSAKCLIFIPLT
jgi:hypothetical protein